MAKKNRRQLTQTEKAYRRYRNAHIALKIAPYPTAFTPFAIELAANWKTWFPEGQNNTSVAIGLCMAIMTTMLSVLAIAKKDSDLMKKVGPFVSVGLAFLAWGAVCIFLSSVLMELGKMLVFAGCGILGAAVEDTVDKQLVLPKYKFIKEEATKNGLTNQGEWQKKITEQAEADGRIRYIPHD